MALIDWAVHQAVAMKRSFSPISTSSKRLEPSITSTLWEGVPDPTDLAHVVPQRTGVGVERSVGREREPHIGPERRQSVCDLDGRVRTAREVANTHARQEHVQAGPIGEFRSDHKVDRAEPRDEAICGAVSILRRHLRKVIGEPACHLNRDRRAKASASSDDASASQTPQSDTAQWLFKLPTLLAVCAAIVLYSISRRTCAGIHGVSRRQNEFRVVAR